jgi:hypothetical protein
MNIINTEEGILQTAINELFPYLKERKGCLYFKGSKVGLMQAVRLINNQRSIHGILPIAYPGLD